MISQIKTHLQQFFEYPIRFIDPDGMKSKDFTESGYTGSAGRELGGCLAWDRQWGEILGTGSLKAFFEIISEQLGGGGGGGLTPREVALREAHKTGGKYKSLLDGRYMVSSVKDGVAIARVFGKKFSDEILSRVYNDVGFNMVSTGIIPVNEKIDETFDFIYKAEAQNLFDMLKLSHYQVSDIYLVGDAIEKIKSDPAFIKYQQSVANGEPLTQQVTLGGERNSFWNLPLLSSPIGIIANSKTINVASNELTWMLRNVTITTTYMNGKASYTLYDKFDLSPSNTRSGLYSIISFHLGAVYHGLMRNSAPRVHAEFR